MNSCSKDVIEIPEPVTTDTTTTDTTTNDTTTTPIDTCGWVYIVKSKFEARCSTSGCHDGTIAPDMSTESGITAQINNGRIQFRSITQGTMPPPGATQTNDDWKNLVQCWIDKGASFD